jgi:hypothetical protein
MILGIKGPLRRRMPVRIVDVAMPVYFFHIRGGPADVEAAEGLEFPDDDAARRAALAGARSLIAADVLDGMLNLDSRIDVADEGGSTLFSVPFASAVSAG